LQQEALIGRMIPMAIHILAISGSLRKKSYNTALAFAAKKIAPKGVAIEVLVPNLPLFNQDLEESLPVNVKKFKQKVKKADAIIFVTPEHNFNVSAVIKNAFEWGSRPWEQNSWTGKLAGIMGIAGGNIATARAQHVLRQMFVESEIRTVNRPQVLVGKAKEKFNEKMEVVDEYTKKKVLELINALVAELKKNT